MKVVVGSAVVGGVKSAVPRPRITPAPSAELLVERQDPDAISLAQVLLTAVPESLRQIAATNLPAVSSILWEEFLDDKRPEWFEELPWEVQSYLIRKFGPQTAWPTEAPTSGGFGASDGFTATVIVTASSDRTSEPTRPATSFTTSYTSGSSQAPVSESSASPSRTISSSINLAEPSETSTPSPTTEPEAPASSNNGLSRDQKIGLGVGIPFGLLGAAALFLACCMLCRRRKKKHVEGSIPPASPGFIPRFAFQDRSHDGEHRTSLIRHTNRSTPDVGAAWDDEGVDPTQSMTAQNPYAWNDLGAYNHTNTPAQAPPAATSAYSALDNGIEETNYSNVPVMMMHDPKPVMAPALYHTHSSNRARGKRTSYTSLHSVAEISEPDETLESPVLGRNISPNHSPARNLMPTPPVPADAQIRRKPLPSSPPLPPLPNAPSPVATSPAAQAASHKLLRQTMPEHSGSSSSGLALTTSSGLSSSSSLAIHAEAISPISPVSNRATSNPFHYDSYVEDYGPEYQYGYVDVDDGLYGGNTSLSQYPEPRRKNSKTEWPLRNIVGGQQRRRSSPIWEKIYEE
ncbi:uncharacterized protein N0V89_004106 [Didymosphaeria variabile]|uniref:Uncharacterized protein n=1 Tax=Didymosphaeria variabile TaxID=1932322 RepID=A0A9W9CC47_9PLEO|nr:uncharacterized protein N0V89_004106 [Didymosphaeria variabile]KAJ4356079.1 hypothetical protein N0V89_004106 [Didymosphaeria variabile]